jgi:FkbM family methyltransferase
MKFYGQIEQDRYFIEVILPLLNPNGRCRYLDVGAYDGVVTSNTYTLEVELGWSGVLIEANPGLAEACKVNRPGSEVHQAIVWSSVLDLDFEYPGSGNVLLSRVANLPHNSQYFQEDFETKKTYRVQTNTIANLLGPKIRHFEYASIDVEGSELEALRGIDWRRTSFDFMTVEYGERKDYLNDLIFFLASVGYRVHRINHFDVEFVPISEGV